jgi:hypothetical protein
MHISGGWRHCAGRALTNHVRVACPEHHMHVAAGRSDASSGGLHKSCPIPEGRERRHPLSAGDGRVGACPFIATTGGMVAGMALESLGPSVRY